MKLSLLLVTSSLARTLRGVSARQPPSLSYEPGKFSEQRRSSDGRILLSNGLSARPIAFSGAFVELVDGTQSHLRFHKNPDAAATFSLPDGGWLYVSNAENENVGTEWDDGGVGAIEFNADGEIVGYERIANWTSKNCGCGKTPWNSFISGEEIDDGRFVQVDPHGEKPMEVLESLGSLGWYESIAYDDQTDVPTFYMARDHNHGIISRFTPDERGYACYTQPNDYDRWCTLDYGTIDYLYLKDDGIVDFTDDLERVDDDYHKNAEGIDMYDGVLYFTTKVDRLLYVVKLLTMEYYTEYTSTTVGEIGFEPDQIVRIPGDDALYFAEDGGDAPGIHVRHGPGIYTTILYIDKDIAVFREEDQSEETTGLAFSPDAMHFYVAFQESGILYDVTRDDMRSFKDETLGYFASSSCSKSCVLISLVLCACHASLGLLLL